MSRNSTKNGGKRRTARQLIKGGVHRLAAHRHEQKVSEALLAPTETPPELAANEAYVAGPVHVPSNLEDLNEHRHWFRIGPMMCTILALGLAWILLIAYFVSRMA